MSYLKLQALPVEQPLGIFYVTKIKAKYLLNISYSEQLQYLEDGNLKGSQRGIDKKRLKEIGKYIDSVEMAFPNTIILAANYEQYTGNIIDDDEKRWDVKEKNGFAEIIIPTDEPLAAIIDGQHRLMAFEFIEKKERSEVELLCSIYFDLPNSYQAYLFATINGNQKKVDKSLALEQFGFNVSEEPRDAWTPEKLAVFFTRTLNFKNESPLQNKVKLSPKYHESLITEETDFTVSTATIVGGIIGLISSNPKRDRVEMGQKHLFKGRSRKLLGDIRDSSPLRQEFINGKDDLILEIVKRFFVEVDELLWKTYKPDSYIFKTVGFQALFDFLKQILKEHSHIDLNFRPFIEKFAHVDFSDDYFQASGIGKSRIKRVIYFANGLYEEPDLRGEEEDVKRLLKN